MTDTPTAGSVDERIDEMLYALVTHTLATKDWEWLGANGIYDFRKRIKTALAAALLVKAEQADSYKQSYRMMCGECGHQQKGEFFVPSYSVVPISVIEAVLQPERTSDD